MTTKINLTKGAIADLLIPSNGKRGTAMPANRLLSLIRSVFNRSNEYCLWDKANPADGIKKFKEKSRSRFLQADELPHLFKALFESIAKPFY